MYQKITEGKFKFSDEKLSKTMSTYSIEAGLYTSITDIVEAMNTLIQDRKNHNETCITVKVSRRTQKVVIMLANDSSGLAFYTNTQTWVTILVKMWETILGHWRKEKVLMNHNLHTILFVSIR